MTIPDNDETQSGGVNIGGGKVGTNGGDIVGRDKLDKFKGMYVASDGDRSREKIVELLQSEIEARNRQIADLSEEIKSLSHERDTIAGAFGLVKIIAGKHLLSVTEYISHTCVFFIRDKDLAKKFLDYLELEQRPK